MPLGRIYEVLTPHARVATAVIPFLAALVARLLFGKNRVTRAILSVSTVWFMINVVVAPYSAGARQEILDFRRFFW